MVCLGNICRSPLAEGIFKSKADPEIFEVDSAGTAGYHIGSPPDPRSIEIGKKYQIDISQQRCRKFQKEDFYHYDHIFVMDRENYRNVCALAPERSYRDKVKLLLEESGSPLDEVPDPYYGGTEGFETVFRLIDQACDRLIQKL